MEYHRILVLAAVAGAVLAWAGGSLRPTTYRASASLELLVANEDFLSLGNIRVTSTPPLYSISAEDANMKTQVEILQQDWLIARALKRMQPSTSAAVPSDTNEGGLPGPTTRLSDADKKAVKSTRANLTIEPSHRSRIINIRYESGDPDSAAAVPNAIAETFIEQTTESRLEAAIETRKLLQRQLRDMRSKLDKSQAALEAFSNIPPPLLTSTGAPGENKLRLLHEELSRAEADRIAKQSIVEAAGDSLQGPVLDSDVVRGYQVTLTDLRRQLADIQTLLTPENYKARQLNAQIAELEGAIAAERAKVQIRIREEYEVARRREAALERSVAAESERVSDASSKMIRYAALKAEMDMTQKFYETLAEKANDAGIAADVRTADVRLLTAAQPPDVPVERRLPLYACLGAMAGLSIGVACVTLKEYGVRRLRQPGEAETFLKVPELGAIPSSLASGSRVRRVLAGRRPVPRVERISWESRTSDVSECFRGTMVSVFSNLRTGAAARSLLITSPSAEEGKTTVVSNLGITLSLTHKRVVLIDADLRRPRLHEIFGVSNSWGLSNLISMHAKFRDLPLEKLVQPTLVNGLYVLTSGTLWAEAPRLLHSDRLRKLIRHLLTEFDHVLIDAPPCLKFADARVLAQSTDGVLLVLRAGFTRDTCARAAVQCFMTDGIPILGTVLNRWKARHNPGYGYSRYQAHPQL